jgi:hypothetical protein
MRAPTVIMARVVRSSCLVVLAIAALLVAGARQASAFEAKPFGIAKFTLQTTEQTTEREFPLGSNHFEFVNVPYQPAFTQAGGHPWGLTTTIGLTSEEVPAPGLEGLMVPVPTRDPRDIVASLPPGLLGNPMAVPRCPLTQVTSSSEQCPTDTQIGDYVVEEDGGSELLAPIVNVTPEKGQSAEFALENTVKIDTPLLTAHLVRTKLGYGFTVASNEIPVTGITHVEAMFWGVPADPSHDPMRGRICRRNLQAGPLVCEGGGARTGLSPVPFLSMPTDCSAGPEQATLRADSWEEPGSVGVNGQYRGYAEETAVLPGMTGCNLLSFKPEIELEPDKLIADEPVGVGVNVDMPQPELPGVNATPHLRNAIVTLPEGMSVSPGVVDGILACDAVGPDGINIEGPLSEEKGLSGELQLAAGHCPDASIVGTAEAITPLLEVPVRGHVYLARPGCGGAGHLDCTEQDALDGNLYKLYLELGGTGEFANVGIQIKVEGKTEANPATGQLTTVFEQNPQAPFSELRIKLNGGPRAPIDNPTVCGPAITTSDFRPWSAPGITPAPESLSMPGTPDATPSSFFEVEGCSNPTPFNPSLLAGAVTPQAGQFSSFTLNLSRQDREQFVKGIQVHTPPGLLGMLSSVPLCGQGEAEAGSCSAASKIGTTRVASGAGSHPFEIEGNVYLTGPYEGAPFGLSIVTHAVAGPFNLGLVIVRARIDVDPQTSELTVTTDETGPRAIPQIIFGVPLRLQRLTVNIDRPNFMFNPTNCKAQQIKAIVSGNQNATKTVQSPFAVGGCKSLAFKQKFTVSTRGRTSRTSGASLDAKLSYPVSALGNDANIARVKVDLPRQLPSRLTTLQKACPSATFDRNPASCPAASVVGVVRARTPLLPVGLAGPVYFVSHGGEAFPSLIVVMQGDGVRVDLTGTTFISKAGITSSTFKTVPDVPVNTFELYLPQGKYSALAANGNLCKSAGKLKMPTEFVGQNGAVLKQTIQIRVTGCKAAKASIALGHRARRSRRGHRAQSSGYPNQITIRRWRTSK